MRITGLEPARVASLEPKSSASANFAISANQTNKYSEHSRILLTPNICKKHMKCNYAAHVLLMPATGIEPVRVSPPAGF